MIYVLELEHCKYYVGRSSNIDKRYRAHQAGSSNWTAEHPPRRIIAVLSGSSLDDETAVTLALMETYGVDQVRGGRMSQPTLSATGERLIRRFLNDSQVIHRSQNAS